jgi:hypothetical protein
MSELTLAVYLSYLFQAVSEPSYTGLLEAPGVRRSSADAAIDGQQ